MKPFKFAFSLFLFLVIDFEGVAATQSDYTGHWAMEMHNGDAGWLSIQHDETGWAGEFWSVGQSKKLSDFSFLSGSLSFVRNCKIGEPEYPNGPPTGNRIPCKHHLTVEGDLIRVKMSLPQDSVGQSALIHTGKRLPPLPDKPVLSELKFGEPIRLFNGIN